MHWLQAGMWFAFVKVVIEILHRLWPKFEETCLFFMNNTIPDKVSPRRHEGVSGTHRWDQVAGQQACRGNVRQQDVDLHAIVALVCKLQSMSDSFPPDN